MVKNNLIIKNFHKYFILIIKKQIDLKKKKSPIQTRREKSLVWKVSVIVYEEKGVASKSIQFDFLFHFFYCSLCAIIAILIWKYNLLNMIWCCTCFLLPSTATFFNYFKSKNDITKKSGSISLPYTPDKITCNQLIKIN